MKILPNINWWKVIEHKYKYYRNNDIHIFVNNSKDRKIVCSKLDNIPHIYRQIHVITSLANIYESLIGWNVDFLVLYNYDDKQFEKLNGFKTYLDNYHRCQEIIRINK